MNITIVQTIPSEANWVACFSDGSTRKVVMWALVEDMLSPGYRWVEGVVHDKHLDLCVAIQLDDFLCYEEKNNPTHMMSFSRS